MADSLRVEATEPPGVPPGLAGKILSEDTQINFVCTLHNAGKAAAILKKVDYRFIHDERRVYCFRNGEIAQNDSGTEIFPGFDSVVVRQLPMLRVCGATTGTPTPFSVVATVQYVDAGSGQHYSQDFLRYGTVVFPK